MPGSTDPHLYCPACRYDLHGLSGDPVRCPECGLETPREQLRAAFGEPTARFRELQNGLTLQSLAILVLAVGVAFGLVTFVDPSSGWGGLLCPAAAFVPAAAMFIVGVEPVRRMAVERGWLRSLVRYQFWTAALILVLPLVWFVFGVLVWVVWTVAKWPSAWGLESILGSLVPTILVHLTLDPLSRVRWKQEAAFRELIAITKAGSDTRDE